MVAASDPAAVAAPQAPRQDVGALVADAQAHGHAVGAWNLGLHLQREGQKGIGRTVDFKVFGEAHGLKICARTALRAVEVVKRESVEGEPGGRREPGSR